MSNARRIVPLALAAAAVLLGAFLLVQQKGRELAQVPAPEERPRPVTVATAQKGNLTLGKDYLAVVEPGREARIAPRVQAEVEEILVQEGDRVEPGQPLVRLESQELEHRLEEVRSRIREAEAELAASRASIRSLRQSHAYWQREKERKQSLVEDGAVSASEAERTAERAAEVKGRLEASENEADAIRSRIHSLRQQKEEARTRLEYHVLKSPSSGVVAERRADPGDMASASQVLLLLQNTDMLKVAFDVPQQDLPEIERGLQCLFRVDGQRRTARISLLHPSLGEHRMKRAEVRLQGEDRKGLRVGSYLPLTVVVDRLSEVTLVPRTALIPSPQGVEHVFVLERERLRPQRVQVLGTGEDRAAVEGISPGAQVVENTFLGWARLSSMDKAEPVR